MRAVLVVAVKRSIPTSLSECEPRSSNPYPVSLLLPNCQRVRSIIATGNGDRMIYCVLTVAQYTIGKHFLRTLDSPIIQSLYD